MLVGALALAAINQIFSLLDPQIFRLTIDRYVSRAGAFSQDTFLRGVGLLLLASVGAALISRIAKNFQDYLVNVIIQRVGTQMYASSVRHSFSLPYSVFEDQRSGELLQKLQKARTDTQDFLKSAINVLFFSMVGVLFVLSYAFIVHWAVGLLYVAAIPVIATITYLISRSIKAAQKRVVIETANLAGSTTETIRNVELVKSLGLTDQEIDRLNAVNDKILRLELQKIIIIRKLSFIQGTIVNGLRSLLLLLMFWLIYTGALSLGEMFSLFIYSFFVFTPLAELGEVAANYQSARASVERLEEILKLKPETRPEHPKTVGQVQTLEFDQVHFRHERAEQAAIQNVTLKMQAGTTVAFVGPSGSGKTTLMKLIVGLYHPQRGAVRFNGLATTEVDLDALRNRIGLVAQDTQLFAGTIRENLVFVKPRASDAEALAVLHAAAADSILDRSTQGLDTKIGEGGLKLSGGEKQRLAIARALLRSPDLIIFDEATSSLDSLTEKSITDTIRRIGQSQPHLLTLLVAHRLSTVSHADQIHVLENGRVVESGTHRQLLERQGLYAALWREQSAVNRDVGERRAAVSAAVA